MAYNNGFYPQYYPPTQNQAFQQNYLQNQQMQNGGFMVVPSEDMARTYPVAPGNCVTFKIEGKPIVMEKSMGFSQLEAPRVDRYRLVREDDSKEPSVPQDSIKTSKEENESCCQLEGRIEEISKDIEDIKNRLEKLEDVGA